MRNDGGRGGGGGEGQKIVVECSQSEPKKLGHLICQGLTPTLPGPDCGGQRSQGTSEGNACAGAHTRKHKHV